MADTVQKNEPLFGEPGAPRDALSDWLHMLACENVTLMESCSEATILLITLPPDNYTRVVEYIFELCHGFELTHDVRHMVVVLFERFLAAHLKDLKMYLAKHHKLSQNIPKDWDRISENVSNQLTLRVATAIQICSKLCSSGDSITGDMVRDVLQRLGHSYSLEAVLKSEVRVLKTIGYHLSVRSPLTYVETLLQLMHDASVDMPVNEYYVLAIKFLDLLVLKKRSIYMRYFHSNGLVDVDQDRLQSVCSDLMLQASAAVMFGCFVASTRRRCEHVLSFLSETTFIAKEDLCGLAQAVLTELGIMNGKLPRSQ